MDQPVAPRHEQRRGADRQFQVPQNPGESPQEQLWLPLRLS